MAENPGAGGGARVAAAQVERRVALGNLTNVTAGGRRLGGPGAVLTDKEMGEARKVKSCFTNVERLKEKLLEEQGNREREEMEPPMLKKIEAKADKIELEFGSSKVLLRDKPDVPPHGDVPQKQHSIEVGEGTLAKDGAESAAEEVNWLEHPLATVSEETDKPMKGQSMLTGQEINADDTALKDMLSGLDGMDKMLIELHRDMDKMNSRQQDIHVFKERLSIERSKVQSLEQEIDQLRSQVALLQSKLDQGDNSSSSTKVPCAINTLAVDSEAKPKLNETEDWLRAVEELKEQACGAKKEPIFIEIDDEDTCMWYDDDDDEKPSLISNDSGSGESVSESCRFTGSYEWFFRGNKLMLSSGMKKHLRELCGCVPPEIPFYIYQMNKSNLKRRGKMRLSKRYISKPLLSCLDKGVGYAHFEVDGEDHGTVRVKLYSDGSGSLTSGWENVVAAKAIKVGDICAFHFKISDGVLKLSVYVFHAVRHLVCVR